MAAEATSSVSKGCFVFKPVKKSKKQLDPRDYFEEDEESSESAWYHANSCEALWGKIHDDIEALQTEVNETIFNDLLSFVEQSAARFDPDGERSRQDDKASSVATQEVPTAALITGVNVPDHSAMFAAITNQLKEKVTPHVAAIYSKNCGALKGLMASLVGQLIGEDDVLLEEDEDELNVKKIPCTFPVLCSWYKETVEKREKQRSSPSKTSRRKSSRKRRSSILNSSNYGKYPPLVLIFEDMESVPSPVLQDFILVCSQYLEKLPLVLVFGIATAVTAIHRTLPQSVSSLLSIEKFQAVPSSVYLTQLINKVLLSSKHPFKLGHKVFQLLLDLFLYHDFSVRNFSKGIQFALMEHFFSQPLSLLCCGYGEAISRIKGLSHDQLELFRKAASFRRYVEGQPPQEQRDLLLDDPHLKKVLHELLKKLSNYHKTFFPVLTCLHELTSDLPHHPLGKQVRELYSLCLESSITETKAYEEAFGLLGILARSELVLLLDRCAEKLSEKEAGLEDIQAVRFHLETLKTKLDTLGEFCNNPVEEEQEADSESASTTEGAVGMGASGSKTTLHSLQQQLLQSSKKKKTLTRYEALRKETLDYLDSVFRKYLACPQSLTLHEIYYYNNSSEVRRHINASPRAAIQTALSNPYHYLQSDLCKAEGGSIMSTYPDICIVYKLHLECGRLINLFDWMQAFIMVINGGQEDAEDDGKEKKKKVDPVLQARFIRGVSELQFLGFIKSTKRKTDHVSRLTWGGC